MLQEATDGLDLLHLGQSARMHMMADDRKRAEAGGERGRIQE